jgi:hypothetical protein
MADNAIPSVGFIEHVFIPLAAAQVRRYAAKFFLR